MRIGTANLVWAWYLTGVEESDYVPPPTHTHTHPLFPGYTGKNKGKNKNGQDQAGDKAGIPGTSTRLLLLLSKRPSNTQGVNWEEGRARHPVRYP